MKKMTKEEKKEANRKRHKKYYDLNKDKIKAYQVKNKEKIAENKKKYWKENKEILSKKIEEYVEKNKEKIRERAREYARNNKKIRPELEKKRISEYNKTRRANDNLFRLTGDIRNIIGKALRRQGYTKKSKTETILGCSFDCFKIYIESKFEHWMTWDNRGLYNGTLNYGWDIDHIIPLSTAKTEEDLIRLNHYENLQPLCSHTNRDIKKDITVVINLINLKIKK